MAVTLNITYLLIPIYLKLHNGPFLIQSKKYPNVQSYSRDLRHLPMFTIGCLEEGFMAGR